MGKDQYVVVQRSGKWWILINSERIGPFTLRAVALDAAVQIAKTNEHAGRKGAVTWDDPDDGTPTVYESD